MSTETTAQQLLHAFMRFNKAYWRGGGELELRKSEMTLLYCLVRAEEKGQPNLKVSEISRLLQVTSPTVTQTITELEHKKLVLRRMDPQDRRAVRVEMTPLGREIHTKAGSSFMATFQGLIEYLGEEESKLLAELLTKVFTYYKEQDIASDTAIDLDWR
jgi:DNA-binding MarR family transcriptional regulator